MTIIVKKPFEPEPFDVKIKGIKDINDTANEQIHPEFEEKPVVESTTQTSEETHGGSELTFSLPNSSQSSGQEQQQNGSTVNNQANQNNTPASNADTNNDNSNANAADNNGDNKGAQEQQNADGEKSNDGNAIGSNADTNNTDVDINTNGQGTQEPQSTTNDVDTQSQDGNDESGSNVNNQDGDNNADSTSVTDNETKQGQENDGDETGDTQEQGNEQDNEQNSENDGEDEESESEDADEQSQSGVYNTQQVVDVVNAVNVSSKYYQTEFYRFIELISEEKTRAFDPMGSDEYNVRKLLFRQYERKPLNSYKMSRVKESVVILLDNSGSMRWWADNLQVLAELAMMRNDVEVYLSPNGHIEEMIYPKYQLVNHDDVIKRLRNRKIIYVGDFDGADTPIILSWYNDVVWICPEERYLNFLEHDWVHYDESKFKGAFLRVFTLQELFSAFKKLLSTPALRFWYDLCNETHRCGGDEDA